MSSVRRNLFSHNLSRRPVSAAPNPLSQGPGDARQPRGEKAASSNSTTSTLTSTSSDNGDIVVKDKNGGYELDIPVLAPLGDEEDGQLSGVDEGGGAAATSTDSTGDTEKEKIEASLMELMGRNRNRQLSHEPAEILNLIQQSLRNKVAALEEDNWMYEPENEPRS
ncbi:hypothetical protein PHISP_02390 [Aspergillus sp. HF37]|nr:hypothetical protein PHISP_02390 [Aspergillus sp. HF37]